jgi:hypothetical protein
MHPLAGNWAANIAKSQRHANPQFQNATMHFEIEGNIVDLTHAGVNMSGKQESATMTLSADGVEYPIPQVPGFVSVCRWVGTHALETMGKKDGAIVGHGTYAVADDGQTMTATVRGVDGQGKPLEQMIVFDKGSRWLSCRSRVASSRRQSIILLLQPPTGVRLALPLRRRHASHSTPIGSTCTAP